MGTVKTDDYKRVRIPDALPGQVFEFKNNGDGTRTLTEVKRAKASAPKCKLVKDKHGVMVLDNGIKITSEDVYKALAEEFP